METKINWGIIGLGNIAHKFASDLQLSKNSRLYGVASRNMAKAKSFSQSYHSITYYDSYELLAQDPKIDVVYVATPHTCHFENTMMCLQYGKSVLCEKPMGINFKEVQIMRDEATSRNLFLMEGIWTRFIPATLKVIELLESKSIGEILFIKADFGFKAKYDPESRIFNKKLGAGSLLDIGIYPVYLSLLTLGIPVNIKVMARMTKTNVDSYCAMLFDYANASKAMLESTIEANTPIEAHIYGSNGAIKMHRPFHHSEKIYLYQNGLLKEVFDLKYEGNGYIYEIEEVNKCIINGLCESDKLPLDVSSNLISVIDRVMGKMGLTYDL